ncbi:S-layer domain protein [Desulforamulus reducens MI-1]|uniref:S-layer domain protein n=1 Tax=Desulforamulus reducens (strain ATCC BAA-1160 / DSM 100696 / MI-1) TaxID=349161 RepID=A4J839_DESRM|nr:S-layer homology domain-containing protein [Desulforamulus reducens]ABO51242.1 S-layer domain protein [Desulforamulus reducens MI-1]
MKKITKFTATLLSVCMFSTVLAGAAWADPWKKNKQMPPGLQKQLIKYTYSANFKDVKNHWAKSEIEELQLKGIMKGYQDQTFKPQQAVSKNEALAIIMRVVDHKETNTDKADLIKKIFPGWMGMAPQQAYDAGILADWELYKWNGNKPATRIEVAMWLCRASGEENVSLKDMLSFAKDTNQLSKDELIYAAAMYNKGIMKGTPDGYLNPLKPISRGEFAVMISRFIDTVDLDDITDGEEENQDYIETLAPVHNAKIDLETKEFTINFEENMALAEDKDLSDLPDAINIYKYDGGRWVTANLEYAVVFTEDEDKLTVKLDNSEELANNTKYCITFNNDILVEADAKDKEKAAFAGIKKGEWCFTTKSAELAIDEVEATDDTTVVIEFNQDIQRGDHFSSNGTDIHVMAGDTELDIDAASIRNNTLTITLDGDDSLEDDEEYTVWLEEDVVAGFEIDEDDAIEFTYED